MKKILVILANPKKGSFNHAITNKTIETLKKNGYEVICHDLYSENFDPILLNQEIPKNARLDPLLTEHCHEISNADGIIIIHPNWWGMPPAILKGWIDRVIRTGVAYQFEEGDNGEGVPTGLLNADQILILNTSDTPEERENSVFGDPLELIWKNCIFGLCGVKNFHRKNYQVIITSTVEQRKEWLKDVEKTVNSIFPPLIISNIFD